MIRLVNNGRNIFKNMKNIQLLNKYSGSDHLSLPDIYKANYYFLHFNQSGNDIYRNELKNGYFNNLYTMMLLNTKNIDGNPVQENKAGYKNKDSEWISYNKMSIFLVVNFNCSKKDVENMMQRTKSIDELIKSIDCESVRHQALNSAHKRCANILQHMRNQSANYCIQSMDDKNKSVLYYNYDAIHTHQYQISIAEQNARETWENILIILSYF